MGGRQLGSEVLRLGKDPVSFEVMCSRLERLFADHELNLVCACCTEELPKSVCDACRHATGWHKCQNPNNHRHFLWRKGSLFAGTLDAQRVLFNLHRKLIPTDVLKTKAQLYVDAGLIQQNMAERVISVIEQERRGDAYVNDPTDVAASSTDPAPGNLTTKLSPQQMKDLLTKREGMMRAGRVNDGGQDSGETDQWRVYSHIIGCIERGELLRLMVQASAGDSTVMSCLCLSDLFSVLLSNTRLGTGKSFLLASVYLYCLVHKKKTKACAPTGIAFGA